MKPHQQSKHHHLKQAGLLHRKPERVHDPLFTEHPDFFDSCDLLQVRYESVRAHLVDGDQVVSVCKRFGTSRQTFYAIMEKFIEKGSSGLLPDKPGPRGPSKLSTELLGFAHAEYDRQPEVSGGALAARIQSQLGVSIHKRTIERLLAEFRSKKNL